MKRHAMKASEEEPVSKKVEQTSRSEDGKLTQLQDHERPSIVSPLPKKPKTSGEAPSKSGTNTPILLSDLKEEPASIVVAVSEIKPNKTVHKKKAHDKRKDTSKGPLKVYQKQKAADGSKVSNLPKASTSPGMVAAGKLPANRGIL